MSKARPLPPLPDVPTLCVGMPLGTLRVPLLNRDAKRYWLHSHAERGNDQSRCHLSANYKAS
ncbi:hypothetical protein C9I49_04655 [Pseudomonas prosekii]|uniref:Uncharacterized protein n=1 Tax=Pseudomonas prosekii TaxID=1148509 RepID=A0A2U2DDE8_9PSED|nr:hypothetical protein C9I49_04655 [Pseudomonas prosekii]